MSMSYAANIYQIQKSLESDATPARCEYGGWEAKQEKVVRVVNYTITGCTYMHKPPFSLVQAHTEMLAQQYSHQEQILVFPSDISASCNESQHMFVYHLAMVEC